MAFIHTYVIFYIHFPREYLSGSGLEIFEKKKSERSWTTVYYYELFIAKQKCYYTIYFL